MEHIVKATVEQSEPVPPETLSDLDYAIHLMTTGERDPDFQARMLAEGDRITEAIRQRHGILNIAVDLVREIRDEG